RLWQQYPEGMRDAMIRLDALVDDAVSLHCGILVRPRGEGDSRFVVFSRATDAVSAACAIQRALHAERWPLPEPVAVRLGVNSGAAALGVGAYYGSAVNRCARLRDIAHGGQALMSSVPASLARERLPAGASLRSLGRHRLRDLPDADEFFQILHPELPAEFP